MFWATYVLLSLHVWMVIHRLRNAASPDVRVFRQRFYNQFQTDVENRVYAAGVQVGGARLRVVVREVRGEGWRAGYGSRTARAWRRLAGWGRAREARQGHGKGGGGRTTAARPCPWFGDVGACSG
jgi:hypothetical protein